MFGTTLSPGFLRTWEARTERNLVGSLLFANVETHRACGPNDALLEAFSRPVDGGPPRNERTAVNVDSQIHPASRTAELPDRFPTQPRAAADCRARPLTASHPGCTSVLASGSSTIAGPDDDVAAQQLRSIEHAGLPPGPSANHTSRVALQGGARPRAPPLAAARAAAAASRRSPPSRTFTSSTASSAAA